MSEFSFWKNAVEQPDRVAVIDSDGNEITAGALLSGANRLVHGLRALGLEKGDAIAVVVGNEIEPLEIFMAIAQAGLYMTPINWHLTAPEIAYIAQDSASKLMICSPEFAETCARAADEAGIQQDLRFCTGTAAGFRAFSEIGAGQSDTLPEDRVAGSPMHYTSGTTGKPKGVRRPVYPVPPEMVSTGYAMFLQLFGIRPHGDAVHLTCSPLYHTAVLNFTTSALHLGHTVVLMRKWDSEGMIRRIQDHRVTYSHMVPTQFVRLLALPEEVRNKYDVSSLRQAIHGAAPCPQEIKHQMLDWWGDVVTEYYAATEGGGAIIPASEWRQYPGSVGKAWPGSTIEIRDDEGTACAPEEVGTVYMCMGQHTFEYHKDEGKTAKAWSDNYFTVGDAGYLNEEGYLYLVDRKTDMIISGGVNIYPAEIETTLILHPFVVDVAAFGIPHEDWGEEVKAVVELADGVEASPQTEAEILSWLGERLAKYKCPKTIDFTEEMPRDPNGKLYKRKLRDPYWENYGRQI